MDYRNKQNKTRHAFLNDMLPIDYELEQKIRDSIQDLYKTPDGIKNFIKGTCLDFDFDDDNN
jgi:hypothetical protein